MAAPKNPNTVAARAAKAVRDRNLKLSTAAQLLREAGWTAYPPVTLADLTARLGLDDHEQQAVLSFSGEPVDKVWTEIEARDLITAWEAYSDPNGD
jgi:hypothetical protein